MARLCGLLLPLVKSFGADLGFDVAARAIMVLGGSGYTNDYPVEQALRDARVFAIYEGTTGMQAQDFLLRQCLAENGRALTEALDRALAEVGDRSVASTVIGGFRRFFEGDVKAAPRASQIAMAEPVMRAGWIAIQAWMCARAPDTVSDAFLATAIPALDYQIARARREAGRAGS